MPEPYERLCHVYDAGWSDFTLQYVPLLEGLLRERNRARANILDLACGTGILAIEMARRGHLVRGIDISSHMIARARKRAAGISGVTFKIGDMRELKENNAYDMVTCTFDAINYIRKLPEIKQVIRAVAASLKQGGLFVFDANTRILYRHHAGETERREFDEQTILVESKYNAAYKLATTTFAFQDGTSEIHQQRPYSYDELHPILEKNGLIITHLMSWFSGIPYSPVSPKVFYVAEKR